MRHTLGGVVEFEGVGIHGGKRVRVRCLPALAGEGIRFVRVDLGRAVVRVDVRFLRSASRYTCVTEGGVEVRTPEHLLAACAGLGITDMTIEIDAEEVPILDGSALPFCVSFLRVGVVPLGPLEPVVITRVIRVEDGDRFIEIRPSGRSYFEYRLSFPECFVGQQTARFCVEDGGFVDEVAPARTFGFYHEVKALLDQGLARGGSLDNAVVIGDEDYLGPLRFEDELSRHKLLDLMGDFWVLGRPILGDVIAYKSGHALSMRALLLVVGQGK